MTGRVSLVRGRAKSVALAAVVVAGLALGTSISALAAKVGGVELEPAIEVAGESLPLRGAGIRKKLFLKLYVAALYASDQAADGPTTAAADAPMAITLDMISNLVTREKMIEALERGFNDSTGGKTAPIEADIEQMLAAMDQPIVDGDSYTLAYEPGVGTHLLRGADEATVIPGLPFKEALFGIWLSDKPAQANLKQAMLGG